MIGGGSCPLLRPASPLTCLPPLRRSLRASVPSDEALIISPRRAQAMLDVGHSRLYELLAAGELKSFKDGKSRKILVASIRDYVARRLAASQDGDAG